MLKVEIAKTPMPFCASSEESFARMPISEKSSVPSMRNAFQPSSRSSVLPGTSAVWQTREFSSSVFPIKQYAACRFTDE